MGLVNKRFTTAEGFTVRSKEYFDAVPVIILGSEKFVIAERKRAPPSCGLSE